MIIIIPAGLDDSPPRLLCAISAGGNTEIPRSRMRSSSPTTPPAEHAPGTERAPPLERERRSRPTQANLNQTPTARRLPARRGQARVQADKHVNNHQGIPTATISTNTTARQVHVGIHSDGLTAKYWLCFAFILCFGETALALLLSPSHNPRSQTIPIHAMPSPDAKHELHKQ